MVLRNSIKYSFFCRLLDIGVTEVMESYHPQSATFQKFGESGCNIRRACPYTKLVHTDVIQIVRTVRFSAKPPQFFLFGLLPKEQFFESRHQRQRPETGFRLGCIRSKINFLTVYLNRGDSMVDCQRIFVEVDGTPPQANALAASQAIERR